MEIDLTQKEDLSLKNTKLVILALRTKMREFNFIGQDRVSFEKLKIALIDGIEMSRENHILNGLARVNLFLTNYSKQIDVSFGRYTINNLIEPSPRDFEKASEDIIRFNLDFKINSIEELYLTRKEEINLLEQYL